MTGKIVSLADYLGASIDTFINTPEPNDDLFLLDEGLELLASYRSITDRGMRLKIMSLVQLIAENQKP